ncbi:MAG: hypothetical protein FD143_760 [Ignavibacteria bacterium]|nr:MAG: hypothetical protein FD143_760 [Ignavibacteria bacterium]KAF0161373.1 MAG: hypothetical protein FD188_961 [Ignavibacteria bacterium]
MKTKFLFTLLFIASISLPQSKINYKLLDANNITLGLQNIGNLYNKFGIGGGYWKMLIKDSVIVYDQGPWVIGKIDNKVHLAISQWGTNYSPGPIINNQAAMQYKPEDSLKYRIYKISKGDNQTNKDYAEWPAQYGAPITEDGKPKIYQDQTLWCVYNAMFPAVKKQITTFLDSLPTMPIEIHQLAYAKRGSSKDEVDLFSNTVFFEWTIINKGNAPIDSAYFSFWTDIDFCLGSPGNAYNIPQMDSLTGLGYLWSNTTVPEPAVGYVLLYGPSVPTFGSKSIIKGKVKNGYKNLGVSSNDAFFGGAAGDKRFALSKNRKEAWNIARGLFTTGETKINPTNGGSTKFTFSGDPVTNTGWLWNVKGTGGGAGFNLFSGPFNMAPNDTQWVMMALVPALGKDYKESITIMRNKVQLLKSMPYDSLAFGRKSVMVAVENENDIPTEFKLEQNYPNPFNPSTVISYKLQAASRITLKVYDVLGREVATLVDEHKQPGSYKIVFNPASSIKNPASGIYFYRLTTPTTTITRKMALTK